MTEQQMVKFRDRIDPALEPGEQLLDVAVIYPTRGLQAVGISAVTRAAAEAIAEIGAVKGQTGSIAHTFPTSRPGYINTLAVTDKRVLILRTQPGHSAARVAKGLTMKPEVIWQVPRSYVTGVESRPRLQLLAKFRLHFADSSSVSVMTLRRRTIEALAMVLGKR